MARHLDMQAGHRWLLRAWMTLSFMSIAAPASAIVTTSRPGSPARIVINTLVGADRFYDQGFFGDGAVMANVEAGHVWNGHETLSHVAAYVNHPSIDATPRQDDIHATAVGFAMNGHGAIIGVGFNDYQLGIAPQAALISTAIATDIFADGDFTISTDSIAHGYRTVMVTGTQIKTHSGALQFRRANVVNSSWGFDEDSAGRSDDTLLIDALAARSGATVTLAAGNHLDGNPPVIGPASGFNAIAVAALSGDLTAPPFAYRAVFSNVGPNDFFNPVTGITLPNIRAAVDLSAPGDNLFLAAYTGTTGSNKGGADPFNGSPSVYLNDIAGTSLAAPIVAGGAALIVDAGLALHAGDEQAIDSRVVKAVLLNSARKIAGWNNGQLTSQDVIRTKQGLDYGTGAGALDLDRAYDQYIAPTANVPGLAGGVVAPVGWDFGLVSALVPNDYAIARELAKGDTFTVTLDWLVRRTLDDASNVASDVAFADLDLQVWTLFDGRPMGLIAESATDYNNVEHLSFTVPHTGYYGIRVLWDGFAYDVPGDSLAQETYGLAWAVVPEPAAITFLLFSVPLLLKRRRA